MKNIIIVLIIAITLPFIGCRGGDQEKIIGVWEEIPFTDTANVNYRSFWDFYSGDALHIRTLKKATGDVDTVVYTYSLEGDKLRVFDGAVWYNGEYWIGELDKKYLKMTKKKDGAQEPSWVRMEFAKR